MRVRAGAVACLTSVTALAVAGCGARDTDTPTPGTTLRVYSALPLQGPAAGPARAIADGELLALQEAGGHVGRFAVRYVSLDDSGPRGWIPKAVSEAARTAAQDRTTIAYLGDLDSGASAISIPILNEAGILQISPSNTAVGLTRSAGADKGEPEKYYPTGRRTYGRVIPADNVQAAAQIDLQRALGCVSTFVLHDEEFYGKGIADQLADAAPSRGLPIAGYAGVDPRTTDFGPILAKITLTGANCVFAGTRTENNAAALFRALHAALPAASLFGPDGLAGPSFASALGRATERQVHLTTPTLARRLYPPAAAAFFGAYRARYGRAPAPEAIYGYEAMRVLLQAIRTAGPGGNDRRAVVKAFFRTRDRDSVLGRYSIDANGDTTLSTYAADRVSHGRLVFDRILTGPPSG